MSEQTAFPVVDFDAQRAQMVAAEAQEDERVFIDPAYPDFMARRNPNFIKIEQDAAGKWDLAADAYDGLGQPVTEVEKLTQLTEGELELLAGCGLHTPGRSGFTVVEEQEDFGPPRGVSYNYTRLVEGELLDATKPAHTPFALDYARSAIHYLMAKSPGDLVLGDLYARNCMVGTEKGSESGSAPKLFFIDTEPFLEPVTIEKKSDSHGCKWT